MKCKFVNSKRRGDGLSIEKQPKSIKLFCFQSTSKKPSFYLFRYTVSLTVFMFSTPTIVKIKAKIRRPGLLINNEDDKRHIKN